MTALDQVNWKIILEELNKAKEKTGNAPANLGLDGGSDVGKAANTFCSQNLGTRPFLDISHKCANILEHKLSKNEKWNKFLTFMTDCKRRIVQTKIGFLSPPKQRTKARFLGLGRTTHWALRILNSSGMGDITADEFSKFDLYLTGVEEFKDDVQLWDEGFSILEDIQKEIKHNGLTRGTDDGLIKSTSTILEELIKLKTLGIPLKKSPVEGEGPSLDMAMCNEGSFFYNTKTQSVVDGSSEPTSTQTKETNLLSNFAQEVAAEAIAFIKSEELKLVPGESILASTDILESFFGIWKYKAPEDALCGITGIVLALPLYTKHLSEELVKAAMETIHWDDVEKWVAEHLGSSMFARRLEILDYEGQEVGINL